eukprot:4699309-Amphidinium_carterae.1
MMSSRSRRRSSAFPVTRTTIRHWLRLSPDLHMNAYSRATVLLSTQFFNDTDSFCRPEEFALGIMNNFQLEVLEGGLDVAHAHELLQIFFRRTVRDECERQPHTLRAIAKFTPMPHGCASSPSTMALT